MQLLGIFHLGAVGDDNVSGEVKQLAAGERLAEILAGDIRQLMGFVENNHLSLRDKLRKTALFDHHIGEKQVMVHHDDVGFHRLFTRFHDKAVFIERAVAAEAVIVGAGDERPDGGIFRHAPAGTDVAIHGFVGPAAQMDNVA